MDPLSPQDPLSQLLGKAKIVKPRPNFTQKVIRSVRQLPQHESVWERMKQWFDAKFDARPLVAAACAVLIAATMTGYWLHREHSADSSDTIVMGEVNAPPALGSAENDVANTLDQMEQFSILLAQQDTRSMSDSDLALLLY